MKRLFSLFLIPFLGVYLTSCDMEKEINLDLPDYESQLAVECYLEDGKPYRLSLFESTSYFDRPEPVLVPGATVIITHNGNADTLAFKPVYDPETGKFYTHTSSTLVAGQPGSAYALEVFDNRGRHVTGFAQFLPPVKMDSLKWKFNDENKALVSAIIQDDPAVENMYRFQIHKDSLSNKKVEIDRFSDDRLNNGKKIEFGSRYRFDRNDTLFVTLYRMEKTYYEFLRSASDAYDANGNPFAQPSTIKSTVQGGIGVFTTLVYDRKQIIIK